jgi:hypothetical protein
MPVGGVSTGFLDIETNGTFGLASIFNSGVPLVSGPWRAPFLGINTGNRTWVLTLDDSLVGRNAEDIFLGPLSILDMEYESLPW